MNLIIHIFGVPIHRHDSLYGMTKHHGSQIQLSGEQWKGFFYREPPFNYGISKVLNAANVARIYIFFLISCCNGDNIQRDSFVIIHTLFFILHCLKLI